MEETKFDRQHYIDAVERLSPVPGAFKASASTQDAPDNTAPISDSKILDDMEIEEMTPRSVTTQVTRESVPIVDGRYSKKSYAARLKPVESRHLRQKNYMLRLLAQPFTMYAFPIVCFAGFLYGANIVWLSFLNATESLLLSNKPYNMATSTLGLTFIAPLVGTSLAYEPPNFTHW